MTRINVIPPAHLTDQHLLAEYRELPRVFAIARAGVDPGPRYVLGGGHVRFFFPRTGYLSRRHAALVDECRDRGFRVAFADRIPPVPGLDADWDPDEMATALNLSRLRGRFLQKPGFYRLRGRPVPLTHYLGIP